MASLRAGSLLQGGFDASSPLSRLARQEWRALRLWWDRRLALEALGRLDDPALKDLGLDRSEIASLVSDASGDRIRAYDPDWRRSA